MLLVMILASLLGQPSPRPSLLLNPRSPQITVNGSGLQSLFSTLDDSLDVHADQGDVELLKVQYSSSAFPTSF